MNHVLSHKFFQLRTILHCFALPSPMITSQTPRNSCDYLCHVVVLQPVFSPLQKQK